jgi:endogenous inhibitor of DNA gyrase (YacG/DUF329 family)
MLKVKCPRCKTEFAYYTSEFRPFCSEKCRLIDLGQWLDGSYAVPAQKLTEEESQELMQLLDKSHEEN